MRRVCSLFGIPHSGGLALLLMVLAPPVAAQLTIDWYTIDGGGHTFSTGGDYRLGGTSGQPDAGSASGSTYVLSGGFWLGGSPPSSVPVHPTEPDIPEKLRIVAGLTNPVIDQTGILLELPVDRQVEVRVFDHSGRLIRQLYDGTLPPGRHSLSWDAATSHGHRVASGVYVIQVRAGSEVTRRRVVVLR